LQFFLDPFRSRDWRLGVLILALFAAVNGMVVFNCFQHEYTIGYDADDHLEYARVLSQGRLPTPAESQEFFCPPLPYAPAALLRAAGVEDEEALKRGKEIQAIYSIVLTFFLLKLCLQIAPDPALRAGTLFLLGMIPAYYRSFVMIRGEPMLAMFAVIGLWLAVKVFVEARPRWRAAAALGIVLGAAALCRQWAILLLPAIGMLALYRAAVDRAARGRAMAHLAVAACACALIAGPFYLHLRDRYGATTAFNRGAGAMNHYPARFYFDVPLHTMLTEPLKHHLAGTMLPIFYSDLWGDYWCYFSVYARTRGREFRGGMRRSSSPNHKADIVQTNYPSMARYLGRENAVAVIPSIVLLGGLGLSMIAMIRSLQRPRPADRRTLITAFLGLCVLGSFIGYLAFIIAYPSNTGDTIKATYMLQTYPALAVLGALALVRLRDWRRTFFQIVVILLIAAAAHGAGSFFTRYI
jgi:hypothetical protein